MNIKIIPSQNRRLHQLISLIGLNADSKEMLIHTYTEGRSISSADLLQSEANNLIAHLETMQRASTTDERCNKMRKKILSICHQMGWYRRFRGQLRFINGKPELDMEAIGTFCTTKGPYKKGLNEHTYKELVVLVSVFERLQQSELTKLNK